MRGRQGGLVAGRLGHKMATHHRPLYIVSFHGGPQGGAGLLSDWGCSSRPPPLHPCNWPNSILAKVKHMEAFWNYMALHLYFWKEGENGKYQNVNLFDVHGYQNLRSSLGWDTNNKTWGFLVIHWLPSKSQALMCINLHNATLKLVFLSAWLRTILQLLGSSLPTFLHFNYFDNNGKLHKKVMDKKTLQTSHEDMCLESSVPGEGAWGKATQLKKKKKNVHIKSVHFEKFQSLTPPQNKTLDMLVTGSTKYVLKFIFCV